MKRQWHYPHEIKARLSDAHIALINSMPGENFSERLRHILNAHVLRVTPEDAVQALAPQPRKSWRE